MSKATITMKLLIDSQNNKVLFAEAGKECVDFIFHILALPVGTVVRCLTKEAMVGSLGNLYDSLDNLGNDYLQANVSKDCLLNPRTAVGSATQVPLLMINQAPNYSDAKKFYRCGRRTSYYMSCHCHDSTNCIGYVSDGAGACCPRCKNTMSEPMTYVAPPVVEAEVSSEAGYVKGVVTYMVMDDLVVKPLSTISSITLLNRFNVKDMGCLEEREITLEMNQGLALLKASLMSKTVLTDVFLGKKGI